MTEHLPVRPGLIATDIDGTIAASDHRPTLRTLRVLRKVEDSGIPVVLTTGRTPAGAEELAREIGLSSPVISCTGGLVTDPTDGRIRWEFPIDTQTVFDVIELGRSLGVMTSVWTAREYFVDTHPHWELMQTINQVPFTVLPDLMTIADRSILKLVLGGLPSRMDEIEAHVRSHFAGRLAVTRGTPDFLDMTNPTATKGSALAQVARDLGLSPADIIAIGDGDNDVSMLTYAGLGVAMENASPAARSAAGMAIGHHDREGVADFLESLLAR